MIRTRSLRACTGTVAIAATILLLILNLTACSDSSTDPTGDQAATPPALPDAQQLTFDFSFFVEADDKTKADGEHDHFFNAYLRTVILDAMAHLVLAAPVSAFSAAIHTVPTADPDGTWVWTYDWQHGQDVVTIILRGLPAGDVVQWDLSLSPRGSGEEYEWFFGSTNGDGNEGHWSFRDLDDPAFPVVGEISWGVDSGGHFLQFMSLEEDSYQDTLRFADQDPDFAITFSEGEGGEEHFIRWHASGTGSLRVPDYNDGEEACWDIYQMNTDCR